MNKNFSILGLSIVLFVLSTCLANAENVEKDRKNSKISNGIVSKKTRLLELLLKTYIKLKLKEMEQEEMYDDKNDDDDDDTDTLLKTIELRQQKPSALLDRLKNKLSLFDY